MPDANRGPRLSSTELDRSQSRWLSSLPSRAKGQFGWAIAAPVLAGLLLVAQVWLLARFLGKAVASGLTAAQAAPFVAGIVGLILLRAVLAWSGERAASRGAEAVKLWLRQALFRQLLDEGPQWTRARVGGELASAIIDQVEMLDGFFTRYVPSSIAAAFLPLAFGAVLLPFDWVAALILLLSAPLIPVFMALVGWGAEAASRRHQRELTRLSGYFADRLRGAFTLKLFGRESAEIESVRSASHALSRRNMSVLRIAFLSSAVLEFFAALGVAGVALYVGLSYLGYLDLHSGAMSLPLGLFALFLAPEVYSPLRQFAANYHDRAAARAAVGQLDALFEGLPASGTRGAADPRGGRAPLADAAPRPMRGGDEPAPADGEYGAEAVRIDALTMHAPGRATPVIRDASIAVGRNERIALMGASGSGKTTMLEAIAGLRRVSGGRIVALGRPVAAGPCPGLGDKVVLLGQQPFFVPGSIAENLRLARPGAGAAEMERALAMACADDFVAACEHGLETRLGIGGYGLSGGQLRRLALARLFLLDPRLVLLDEPTEYLDAVTKNRVIGALLDFCRDRTLIAATHDPDLAARMDRVYAIDQRGGVHERA